LTWRNVLLHENSTHTFNDATVSVDLQGEPVNHGVIVATNPLSLEGWVSFAPGELKVLHAGTIEFASGPALKASAPADPISVSSPMPAAAGAGVLVSDGA
jgi:hypothetical protein